MESKAPTPHDDFFFDLRGYLILENAVEPELLDDLNRAFDNFPELESGKWWGNAQRRDYTKDTGFELHNCVEAGEPFERLIDYPGWFAKVKHFVGGERTFDWHHGPIFIDENFANLRGPGEAIGLHSGGYAGVKRNQFRYHNGRFQCGQVNILTVSYTHLTLPTICSV